VSSGATPELKLDNDSLFNGKHVLKPGEQLVAFNDFKGATLYVNNLTPYQIKVLISIFCPGD
jgi:hypothetical protein